ncbi:MAG: hypothetical protein AAGC67_02380 [Myxococcota bacterium]
MSRPRVLFAAALLVSGLLASSLAEAGLPSFPAPPGADVVDVSSGMNLNGANVSIRRFETDDTVEEVTDYYKRRWSRGPDGELGYREALTDVWYVLSHLDGEHLLALQIQPASDGGSWGYLSVSDLPEQILGEGGKKGRAPAFPSMAGSVVLDDQGSKDPGKKGRVLALSNDFSPTGNATFYRDHYRALGWKSDMDVASEAGHALTYSTRGKTVRIVIQGTEEGGSVVVANEVEVAR